MKRLSTIIAVGAIALILGAAVPVTAQHIPAGEDRWVTPGDGGTSFSFPYGDVESLCGATPSATWDHRVELAGVPEPGWDWDTAVLRMEDVELSDLPREIKIQVTRLVFSSIEPQKTPCGDLFWTVELEGNQPITQMKIVPSSNPEAGVFFADIVVRVVFHATDTRGNPVGKLHYTLDLPDHVGVPWSYANGMFRPGIDEKDNCIHVLRQKLAVAEGDHKYFIENLIAKGRCNEVAKVKTLSVD